MPSSPPTTQHLGADSRASQRRLSGTVVTSGQRASRGDKPPAIDPLAGSSNGDVASNGDGSPPKKSGDGFVHMSVVTYPGYNPAGPYMWPPVAGERTSQRKLVTDVLKENGHTIQRYGVKKDITSFILSVPMQLFMLDAFWWLFLQHFSAVDFHTMIERNRRGALATDAEIRTYMGGTGATGTTQPKRPMRKHEDDGAANGAGGGPGGKGRGPRRGGYLGSGEDGLPAHLTSHRGRVRHAEDVVRVATPSLTEENLRHLDSVLQDRTGVADNDDDASVASSTEYSPSATSATLSTSFSDISAASAKTVDGILRVTNFAFTFPSLSKLPPEARASIVAREQHQLFTRMAAHYAQAVQRLAPRHFTVKDAITRLVPDLAAQILFAAFWRCIPYGTHLFDLPFQRDIATSLSMWIGGVAKLPTPRLWPVHRMLDTIYKTPLKRAAAAPGKVGSRTRRRSSVRFAKDKEQQQGAAKASVHQGASSARGLGSFRSAKASPAGHATTRHAQASTGAGVPVTPRPPASGNPKASVNIDNGGGANTARTPAGGGNATGRLVPAPPPGSRGGLPASVGQAGMPPSALDDVDEFLLDADQRRQRAVEIEVTTMRAQLNRLMTTHTFTQAHYAGNAGVPSDSKGRGRADNVVDVKAPGRVANVAKLGPQKRTVQVIKADLDAKYHPEAPWYGNPKQRTRIRETTNAAKFAVQNWSPLLHRFMLGHGSDNRGRPDAIHWTV